MRRWRRRMPGRAGTRPGGAEDACGVARPNAEGRSGNHVLKLDQIRTDGGTQPRAALHPSWVEEYAHDMMSGAELPPVIVFYNGSAYWLADGFHRYHAAAAL